MTINVSENIYKAITEQKRPFLITKKYISPGEVITVGNKGRLQYALVTCTVKHNSEYIIGLKTYLGKADYSDFARLRMANGGGKESDRI